MRRVELPVLEGVDSQGWGSRAEKFLAVHHVSTMEKLKVVFHPNHWCKFWRKNSKKSSCNEFSMALIQRFGGKERKLVFERFARLKENRSVLQPLTLLLCRPHPRCYCRRCHHRRCRCPCRRPLNCRRRLHYRCRCRHPLSCYRRSFNRRRRLRWRHH